MLLIATAVVLLLVVLNGLFAMSELAVGSSRRPKLQAHAERGDKGAAAALKLRSRAKAWHICQAAAATVSGERQSGSG